ncbi:MAG: cadmium-translocating P-type ATPase [Tenericutes bacterium]|nr:cadmium-translocating P-type ATPase [Mycoplasmatota bacterium]
MKRINEDLVKIIISTILFIISFFIKDNKFMYFAVLLVSYVVISYELYVNTYKNILEKEFFDEDTLMILATIGAFCIGEYVEAVLVILLFQLGEYLSDVASSRTKDSITSLMDLRSDTIHLLKDGVSKTVLTSKAKLGDIFAVLPGEIVPLDGVVEDGISLLNTASLTGESVPREVGKGDIILSGVENLSGVLKIKATSTYETSTASKIIDLMEHSNDKKTKTEKFITKFSRIYTPVVVLLAILIAIIPIFFNINFKDSLYQALVFLVMSCPCALVISVPLGFFQGIGRCSKEKILVKGSNELDSLSNIEAIAFDKTGTITEGKFKVTDVVSKNKKNNLLKIAAHCESYSNHPIAKSIIDSYDGEIDKDKVSNYKEISGKGISCKYDGVTYYLGNLLYMKDKHIEVDDIDTYATIIYMASKNEYLGYLVISDAIKRESKKTITNLKNLGIKRILLLSGDNEKIVKSISNKVGINEYYDSLLPQDKVEKVEELTKEYVVAFVGDGMNDAPVIKRADIGISMGGIGSDVAIEASDVVLMKDEIEAIPKAIKISKLTKRVVKYNIFLAIAVKAVVLILALLGFPSIWMAIVADVVVTLLSVLNTFVIQKKRI